MATPDVLNIRGYSVTEIFPAAKAKNRVYIGGKDSLGPYIASRLANKKHSPFFGWYILVSPEDWELMEKYNWCARVNNNGGVEVRRRKTLARKQYTFLLARAICERMDAGFCDRAWRTGHPLDFRRSNLSLSPHRKGFRGVTQHIDGNWQVQMGLYCKTVYIGRAASRDEGYRLYNQYLKALKDAHPNDRRIQDKPFNDVNPLF